MGNKPINALLIIVGYSILEIRLKLSVKLLSNFGEKLTDERKINVRAYINVNSSMVRKENEGKMNLCLTVIKKIWPFYCDHVRMCLKRKAL